MFSEICRKTSVTRRDPMRRWLQKHGGGGGQIIVLKNSTIRKNYKQ